ncbi:MAG: GspH/FimT family pseudopilin [bacterium]|nr:GspH/FimT family pseudopilin [bacterium]
MPDRHAAAEQRSPEAGFTLMEVLVTLLIISMLFAMVVPNLSTFVPGARLEGSGKQIQRRLDFLRSEAQIRGREMSLELDLDRDRWRVVYPPDLRLSLDQDQSTLEEWSFDWMELETGVVFSGAGDSKNGIVERGLYRIRFDEYGFAADQMIVLELESEPDRKWSLELRGLTGATGVTKTNDGERPELPFVGEGAF